VVANISSPRVLTGIRPKRFVISLSGSCCRCGTKDGQACGTCQDSENTADYSSFNGYFEVTQDAQNPDHYLYRFPENSPHNAQTLELRLNSNSNQPPSFIQVCVFITFGPDADDNPVRPVAWGKVSGSVSEIGVLRRRGTNTLCCWPHQITVSPAPVPDFVAPQPEWMPGDPDDLNHAPFWPSLGFDLMEDGDFAPIRYANGELQLRIKDLGSEAFGIPWGHTRIYSHRLSNSHDYGNGYNWMVHEWPRLVSFKSPLKETPPGATHKKRTGCTIALTRGTRNALWFDETKDNTGETTWEPRFGATHVLKHYPDEHLLKIFAPNGHVWEFYDFTSPCSREFQDLDKAEREKIAPGCLKRHIGPYGATSQQITMTYKNCQLRTMERSAPGSGQSRTKITETFTYQWKDDQISSVTLSRQGDGSGKRNVSRANYTYYGKGEDHGNPGDLKTVQVEFWDGTWKSRPNTLQYYAYYKQSNSTYSQGMLKAVIGPESLHRMKTETGKDPVATGPLREYSDLWLDYFTDNDVPPAASERVAKHKPRRVKSITMNCGGRTQTYEYGFSQGGASPDQWFSQTTESRPDDSIVKVISDVCGETMIHSLKGKMSEGDKQGVWTHGFHYLHFGLLALISTPATSLAYEAKESGELVGDGKKNGKMFLLVDQEKIFEEPWALLPDFLVMAANGKPVLPLSEDNDASTFSKEITLHSFQYGRHRMENQTVRYLEEDENPQCNLKFEYEWYGSDSAGLGEMKVTLPAVPKAQHGDNKVTSTTVKFNHFGMAVESTDERDVVTKTKFYDELSVPSQITIEPKKGEALVTDITADVFGRVTKVYGPKHRAVTDPNSTQTELVRRASWTVYDDVTGTVISSTGFHRAKGNEQLINPVSLSEADRAGRIIQQVNAIVRSVTTPGKLKVSDVNSKRNWCRQVGRTFDNHDLLREERVFYDIQNEQSYSTRYSKYDAMFRLEEVIAPDGTRTETKYEARGHQTGVSMGTTVLVPISSFQYDDGEPQGNGNLTEVTNHIDSNKDNDRITRMTYDWRDQMTSRKVVGKNAIENIKWDAAGREDGVEIATPPTPAAERNPSLFPMESAQIPRRDPRGQVYQNEYYQRNINRGQLGAPDLLMSDQVWRDQSGNPTKVRPAGSLAYQVMQYDSLGRETYRKHAFGPLLKEAPPSLTQEPFVESIVTEYDPLGQPVQIHFAGRPINSYLHSPGINDAEYPTRFSFLGTFYDPLGRVVASVDHGTTRLPRTHTAIPKGTDSRLVVRYFYNSRGELEKVVDPKSQVVAFTYDDAGRTILQNENFVRAIKTNYLPDGRIESIDEFDLRFDRTKRAVTNFYGPGNSTLKWDIQTNLLPAKVIDADGSETTFGYNRQAEVTATLDSRGCQHSFIYDVNGQQTDDIVVECGDGVDSSVRRIHRDFDDLGRLTSVATYASVEINPTQEITGVSRTYSFAGQVNLETTYLAKGVTKSVRLFYLGDAKNNPDRIDKNVSISQELLKLARNTNSIRQIGLQYPSKRNIGFEYGRPYSDNGSEKSPDYWLSRITTIHNLGDRSPIDSLTGKTVPTGGSSDNYADYTYWGVGNVYQTQLAPRNVDAVAGKYREGIVFSLASGAIPKPFGALDGLGRLKTLSWDRLRIARDSTPFRSNLINLEYDYNRSSLRVSQRLRTSLTENRSHETFGYDDLNRLDSYRRVNEGRVEPPLVTPSNQTWTLDASGNWLNWDTRGPSPLHQTRKHDPGDRIQSITNLPLEPKWAEPAYDAAGNLIQQPSPPSPRFTESVRYDAWNRPVSIKAGDSEISSMIYDGLGRVLQLDGMFSRHHYTYSPDWQLLEEEVTPKGGKKYRYEYIWGVRGPDDLVCREKYEENKLTRRDYALSDANGNVVGIVPTIGGEEMRVVTYDPYGQPTDQGDFAHLFGGYYYDHQTGLYLVRNRVYHPTLGRWLQKDPAGMVDGTNLYQYCAGNPVNFVDPTGEDPLTIAVIGAFAISAAHGWSQTMMASNGEAGLGDQALGAGLGLLGGFNMVGTYTSAGGSIIGYYGGQTGAWDPVAGYQWGGLAGGLAGDVKGVLQKGAVTGIPQAARQFGWGSTLARRARNAAPELLSLGGSIGGAAIGSQLTDDPLLGANLGMMAGGSPGGLWRLGRTLRVASRRFVHTAKHRVPWSYGDTGRGIGATDPFGNITIRPGLRGRELKETIAHESVHRFFSPRPRSFFVVPRAYFGAIMYKNSYLVTFLEEATAEAWAKGSLLRGLKFPFQGPEPYVTGGRLALEAGGSIVLTGGLAYGASHAAYKVNE